MASVYSGAGEGTRCNVTVRGEVQFSLLYNYRLGALEVGVKRCKDLAPVDTKRNRSDPYVKVLLRHYTTDFIISVVYAWVVRFNFFSCLFPEF
jgi:hypothetical protein